MTLHAQNVLAVVVVVRVGSADLWALIRRLLSAGVRIGTEEQLAHRAATVGTVRITYGDTAPETEGTRI
jgi:hypothetical protein